MLPQPPTPEHLADKMVAPHSGVEGERKQVTVLFADVKDSMDLAKGMDTEEWAGIMQGFFQLLSEGVARFEGFVDKFTGDGIMALFGAPIAYEDHAHRACYAALHLSDELRRYANELRFRKGLSFSARMGINSGEVVVGKIGDGLGMTYTAQGHTVGLAARMEQIAEPGRIYVSEHTAGLVRGFFDLGDLGQLQIKGASEPVRVYELQGIGPLQTRLDVSRTRGLSRFVGRTDEMQALESALAQAQQANAQIVALVGEAGLGKSRLCYEFLQRCRARGLVTYETRGVSHGKNIPFLPILQLFRTFFRITENDDDAAAREKIAGRLLPLDERLRESLPLVFDFLGVFDREQPALRIDPEARQRQLFKIVRTVIQAQGREKTTVILLENLHWFDAGSEAFLKPLFDAQPGTRGLVILNFRPGYQASWMAKPYYHQVPLRPLASDASRQLLDDLLGSDPSSAALAELIHSRTAGNPFFTEEVIQSLIESGKLVGSKGSYQLTAPVEKIEVPSTVQSVLAARIDRLPTREKQVLQAASVIGREFSQPILAAVTELPPSELSEALQRLESGEFVYKVSLYPVVEYVFKHPLTQEVALGSQLQDQRRCTHGAVAHAVEAASRDNLDEQAALLAHHWENAGDGIRAASWHRRAAEWTGVRGIAEAAGHWQRVRELAQAARGVPESAPLGAAACGQLLSTGWRLGVSEEDKHQLFQEGKDWVKRSGDVEANTLLELGYATTRCLSGDAAGAIEHIAEAARLASQTANQPLSRIAALAPAYPLFVSGEFAECRHLFEQMAQMSPDEVEYGVAVYGFRLPAWSMYLCANIEAFTGSLETARALLERGLEMARRGGEVESEGWGLGLFSSIAQLSGEVESALSGSRQSVAIAERIGSSFSRIFADHWLAVALTLAGQWEEAIEIEERVIAEARRRRTGLQSEVGYLACLAEARLGAGQLLGARAAAEEGVAIGRHSGAKFSEAWAQLALARALMAQGGVGASASVHQSLNRCEQLIVATGGKNLRPYMHLERATLAALEGRRTTQAQELGRAHQLLSEMRATSQAERVRAQLAALDSATSRNREFRFDAIPARS